MCKKKATFRYKVHYHQVDQMGIVHHAQYLYFLEQSRIQWLENFGIRYAILEKKGILLPVVSLSIDYKKPLHFDDTFLCHISLDNFKGSVVSFSYRIEDEEGILYTTAKTTLVFVNAETRKAMKCPKELLAIFSVE